MPQHSFVDSYCRSLHTLCVVCFRGLVLVDGGGGRALAIGKPTSSHRPAALGGSRSLLDRRVAASSRRRDGSDGAHGAAEADRDSPCALLASVGKGVFLAGMYHRRTVRHRSGDLRLYLCLCIVDPCTAQRQCGCSTEARFGAGAVPGAATCIAGSTRTAFS